MTPSAGRRARLPLLAGALAATAALAQVQFVNFESSQVHPLELTPDGATLLAVNTADGRVELFDAAGPGVPEHLGSVFVGLEPVSVRARTASEAWVVNHLSDSVTVVDLPTRRVVGTVDVGDEPCDVVFAGDPERAYVSSAQRNELWIVDPSDLTASPEVVPVTGEEPRALATDGERVFAAFFDSGNGTTALKVETVLEGGPYGGQMPPPNDGGGYAPPIDPLLPPPGEVSHIVRKQPDGRWLDDNGGDWSADVGWDLHDHDVAIVGAGEPTYATTLMHTLMAIALRPDGRVTVVGTDATNEIRFEPNVRGTFLRVRLATFDPDDPAATTTVADLNPHLDYSVASVAQSERDRSLGDPRALVWDAAGARGYVAGMGSNNVVVIGPDGERLGRADVGAGPTGLALDEARDRLYVLERFDATIAAIEPATLRVLGRVAFYDPTPEEIRTGRPLLYDTHERSGLGHVACASCHVDARSDYLAWDLGDPAGVEKPFDQTCFSGQFPDCRDWHPMKGPMVTQSLLGIAGTEPLHWRGDRDDVAEFAPAYVSLLADDAPPSAEEMADLEAFLATLTHPPNPWRAFDGTLRTLVPNGGDAVEGERIFLEEDLSREGTMPCATCHHLPLGTNSRVVAGVLLSRGDNMKVPHLRGLFEKIGFDQTLTSANRGFGFAHNGSEATLQNFLDSPDTFFPPGAEGEQMKLDLEAFLMSLSTDTHAGVGRQTTVVEFATAPAAQRALVDDMFALADTFTVGLIAKAHAGDVERGYAYLGGDQFQSDQALELVTRDDLLGAAAPGSELTLTIVPQGTKLRIGADRDVDGFLDGDERVACSDGADPDSVPGAALDISRTDVGAGQDNTGDVRCALPGWELLFAFSFAGPGTTVTPYGTLDLANARPLGSAVAGADGVAELTFFAPLQSRGRRVWWQAIVAETGDVSDVESTVVE